LNEAFLLSSAESLGINQWPTLPAFREATLEYLNVTMALAYKLTRLVRVALELGADYFASFFDADCGTLRLSHYPVVKHEEHQWGLAAHTDSNFFTLLPTNDVAGLSIRPEGSDWIDADMPPRCFRQLGIYLAALDKQSLSCYRTPREERSNAGPLCDTNVLQTKGRHTDYGAADLCRP
jgi:hypothetical protein